MEKKNRNNQRKRSQKILIIHIVHLKATLVHQNVAQQKLNLKLVRF